MPAYERMSYLASVAMIAGSDRIVRTLSRRLSGKPSQAGRVPCRGINSADMARSPLDNGQEEETYREAVTTGGVRGSS